MDMFIGCYILWHFSLCSWLQAIGIAESGKVTVSLKEMEKFLFYRIPLRENIVYFQKEKYHLDELLSMEDEILMVNKLPQRAGGSRYLEGPLAEYHAVFECAVFSMKDGQNGMALHNSQESYLGVSRKDPEVKQKIQPRWLEKEKGWAYF